MSPIFVDRYNTVIDNYSAAKLCTKSVDNYVTHLVLKRYHLVVITLASEWLKIIPCNQWILEQVRYEPNADISESVYDISIQIIKQFNKTAQMALNGSRQEE